MNDKISIFNLAGRITAQNCKIFIRLIPIVTLAVITTGCWRLNWTRYELCNFDYRECETIATFEKYDNCLMFDKYFFAYCNLVSRPGQVTCDVSRRDESTQRGRCI